MSINPPQKLKWAASSKERGLLATELIWPKVPADAGTDAAVVKLVNGMVALGEEKMV